MDPAFFDQLYSNEEFCNQLGRTTLAAGRFESNLRAYLLLRGVAVEERHATLGRLIAELRDNGMLSQNGVEVLNTLKAQRNYLTHSLFDLFVARVDGTLLPRPDSYPPDLHLYTEKAWELEQNLVGLNDIVEERIACRLASDSDSASAPELLFRS